MNDTGTTSVRTGRAFEHKACHYLQQQGLELLAQNYHCPGGEIDLIMRDGEYLVFIEVRYRRHTTYGNGVESIDWRKQQRLIACAGRYLQQQHTTRAVRFDVISFSQNRGKETLEWIKDAFQA
jgi:putative endonuclease